MHACSLNQYKFMSVSGKWTEKNKGLVQERRAYRKDWWFEKKSILFKLEVLLEDKSLEAA